MAIASSIDLDTQKLRDEIRAIYARVATDPSAASLSPGTSERMRLPEI